MLRAPGRWWTGLTIQQRRLVLIATTLLFAYGFFQQRTAWNETSRYDLVRAIVDEGRLQIDSFHANTGDKAFYAGHWYSDKPPGTALIGVPVYAALRVVNTVAGSGTPGDAQAMQALAFVESGIPTALLVVALIAFLAPLVGEAWAVLVGLAYGLGSIAFPFATMFFGHAASTAALFGAFFVLHRQRREPRPWGPYLAGFLAGCAVIIEIPVGLGVVALFLYALYLGPRVAVRFVAGGLPLAAVLGLYDWLAFGNPLSIGYQYATVFGQQNAQGIVSIVWPKLETAEELLFGPRGLVRLAPWFVVAPLGLIALRRRGVRAEIVVAAVICAAFLTYNSGALNPLGGWTPGPRYLMPALPFAAVLVAIVPASLRYLAAPLMVVGIALMTIATVTMPNAPELYVDPLSDLWLPRLAVGNLAPTGARLQWGLDPYSSLAILLTGLGLGLAVVALTFVRPSRGLFVSGRAVLVLAVLALVLSFPFLPLGHG